MIYMKTIAWLTRVAFILSLPLLFASIGIRFVSTSEWFYERGFDTYDIVRTTDLERPELVRAGRELVAYFRSAEEPVSIQVRKDGKMIPLFNEREVQHLKDVKGLFQLNNTVGETAGLYIIAYALTVLSRRRRGTDRHLAELVQQGSALVLSVVVLLGIGSLIDFQALFVRFHVLSFSNDLWMLDPSRDYLIMMFPTGFWIDATVAVMAIVALQGLVAGGAAYVYLRKHRRNMAQGIGLASH